MKPRPNGQRSLPPMELRDSERPQPSFRNSEQAEAALSESEQGAARIFDQAVEAAGLTNKDVAHLCGVSVSLVEKWRSTEQRGAPSFVQMLMLPPSFHWHLHRALNRRFGFGKAALSQVLEGLGMLAVEQ